MKSARQLWIEYKDGKLTMDQYKQALIDNKIIVKRDSVAKTVEQAREYYESLSYENKMKLQDEFGRYGEQDRDTKFYKWIRNQKL